MNPIKEPANYLKLDEGFSWDNFVNETGFIKRLEIDVLPGYLQTCRWFAGKARKLSGVKVSEVIPFPLPNGNAYLLILETIYTTGKSESYLLPLTLLNPEAVDLNEAAPNGVLASIEIAGSLYAVTDGVYSESFRRQIFNSIATSKAIYTLAFERGIALAAADDDLLSRLPDFDSSNTTVIYGEKYFFKLYRKLFEELNPDVELVRFLSEKTTFSHIPAYAGSFYKQGKDGSITTLGLLQRKVEAQANCWDLVMDYLSSFNSSEKSFEKQIELLGKRTAEMHIALGSDRVIAAFAPSDFDTEYREWLYNHLTGLLERRLELLKNNMGKLDEPTEKLAHSFMDSAEQIRRFFSRIKTTSITSLRTRIHGDYHLGQVLYNGNDFIILDFEGEPESSVRDRKIKHSPLKDVAGMLRSFHYAVSAKVIFNASRITAEDKLLADGEEWLRTISTVYLDAYFNQLKGEGILDVAEDERNFLLELHLLEKAIYELGYELNSRPDWVRIPLKGIESVLKDIVK